MSFPYPNATKWNRFLLICQDILEWLFYILLVFAVIGGIILLFAYGTTPTADKWTRIDSQCFVREDFRDGVWPFTPDKPSIREVLCVKSP